MDKHSREPTTMTLNFKPRRAWRTQGRRLLYMLRRIATERQHSVSDKGVGYAPDRAIFITHESDVYAPVTELDSSLLGGLTPIFVVIRVRKGGQDRPVFSLPWPRPVSKRPVYALPDYDAPDARLLKHTRVLCSAVSTATAGPIGQHGTVG